MVGGHKQNVLSGVKVQNFIAEEPTDQNTKTFFFFWGWCYYKSSTAAGLGSPIRWTPLTHLNNFHPLKFGLYCREGNKCRNVSSLVTYLSYCFSLFVCRLILSPITDDYGTVHGSLTSRFSCILFFVKFQYGWYD